MYVDVRGKRKYHEKQRSVRRELGDHTVIRSRTWSLVRVSTFPPFNFSYFYLYKEGIFGSIGNVSRDGILFVT